MKRKPARRAPRPRPAEAPRREEPLTLVVKYKDKEMADETFVNAITAEVKRGPRGILMLTVGGYLPDRPEVETIIGEVPFGLIKAWRYAPRIAAAPVVPIGEARAPGR